MLKKLLLSFFLCSSVPFCTIAQKKDYSNITPSIAFCGLSYLGDLTPNRFGDMSMICPGVQASVKIPVTKNIGFRPSVIWGSLKGNDDLYGGWRKLRSFSFTSNIIELSAMVQWEFRGHDWDWPNEMRYATYDKLKVHKRVSPYLLAGIGYLSNNVSREMDGIDSVYFQGDIAWENYRKEAAAVYKTEMMVAQLGIGTHILLNSSIRLYLEYCYHAVFNDHLDGFGTAVKSDRPDAYQRFTIGFDFRLARSGSRKEMCYLDL